MDDNIGLLGSLSGDGDGGGGGDGVASDESTTAGSILTSNNNNQEMGISTEVSSPLSDENLELGLGLSIGGRGSGGLKSKSKSPVLGWGQFSRILTTKDFTSLISNPSSNSSSSSVKNPNLSTLGSKRFANDSASGSASSVVGWPPIRKGHKLTTQTKLPDEQSSSTPERNKAIGNNFCSQPKNGVSNKGYRPVKVHMDGSFIGRKVDLNAHNSYSTLAQTLEDMFYPKRSSFETAGPSKLLNAKSEFVLTYEDKDGDCMLVGDVPWQMFTSSVKRLRIMRNCESSELGNRKPLKQRHVKKRTRDKELMSDDV